VLSKVDRPVAVLFYRLGPYHLARLKAAAELFPTVGIEVFAKDRQYPWEVIRGSNGFRRVTLFESEDGVTARAVAEVVSKCLDGVRPAAVVVPGWSSPEALSAIQWALGQSVPVVLFSESQAHDRTRWRLRELVKRRVVGMFTSALVGGISHLSYLERLGFPRERIFTGYDVVDNEHFARGADAVRNQPELRARLGLPDRYFLASSRFVSVKNLPRLLEAYWWYRQAAKQPWSLVLLGDGPLAPQVRAALVRMGIQQFVHLPGFRQYLELPTFYGLALAFILASTSEPWGLVVNEAMAAGLPVLVSNRCGCAPDLVEEGRNGFTFDPYDTEGLARLMLRMSTMSDAERAAMGQASREIISRWSPEVFAQNLRAAVETALNTPRPRPSLANRFDRTFLWALIHCRRRAFP
jgi:1,2-diacylglycerol 3-alpha-glucosyltransferase